MFIIPEISTIVIMPPRTSSGTLKRAIKQQYPKAWMPYRHMEASGIPDGYTIWRKVALVRKPLDRLWSLYTFLRTASFKDHSPSYTARMRASVQRDFIDWVLNNEIPFTDPWDDNGNFNPLYNVQQRIPENRRSQYQIVRPDLGTHCYRFEDQLDDFYGTIGLERPGESGSYNVTGSAGIERPELTIRLCNHIVKYMKWDAQFTGSLGSIGWEMGGRAN